MNELKQIATKFEPTAEQIEFAKLYVKHHGNISRASEEFGNPTRTRYYTWKSESGEFEKWLQNYAKDFVLSNWGRWYLIALKYADAGSFQHLNMLMQIAKEFVPTQRTEIDLVSDVNINLNGQFTDFAKRVSERLGYSLS